MDAIEKRARELLAAEYYDRGHLTLSNEILDGKHLVDDAILRTIIRALTPPEGYVLVPTVLPEKMLDALYCAEGDMCDDDMQKLWQQLLAARPEVP